MIRSFLSSAVQKKYFLMFFTCVIYITGLFAFFNDSAVLISFMILIMGLFAIIKNYLSPKLVLFWYFMFFFAFFNASYRTKTTDALYQISPQNAMIKGQIVSIPTESDNKTKFFFQVKNITFANKTRNVNEKTLVTMEGSSNVNIGNSYSIQGKLRTPFESTNPSQFDYGKYLQNFNVFTVFYANSKDCIMQSETLSLKWLFLQKLNNMRNDIIQVHSECLKSPNIEILGGIVFGDDAIAPPQEIKESFRNSGLLHILAASGMNVALIYGIWFFILRRLKVPFNLTVFSGIFVVVFYSLMTGLGPSVIRAAAMLIFILIGKLIDRDAHSISLLAFVALLMLIYKPSYINDVGFQLSFLVTFGLLLGVPIVFEKVKRIPSWLSGAIFVPIIAQIWVAPIQMFYFNSFSLYSVFANIVILPFVTFISFGGFISSVLALIKPVANHVCFLFDMLLNPVISALVSISNYFANLPLSLVQTPQPESYQIFLYYGIVLLTALFFKIGKDKKIIISIFVFLCLLVISCMKLPNNNLETIFFDVQNADAFLLKTPDKKYFIIDSGKMGYRGGKTQAQNIILAYLRDMGIKNIEGFIITHFDSDHAGGASDLIGNLNIKNIYVNSLDDESNLAQKIYSNSKNSLKLAKNNEVIYDKQLKIRTFIADLKGRNADNENSVITLVSDGDFDILFMGDAGIAAFDKIKGQIPQKIEVIKIGHHGAKNVLNDEFLMKTKPRHAIISTGFNLYGHPNGVTLELLKKHNVKILRTDKLNAIKIIEKNNDYRAYSYSDNKFNLLR